jgi:hypothetical protein
MSQSAGTRSELSHPLRDQSLLVLGVRDLAQYRCC